MYLVYIEDNEQHKKILFVTDLRVTADSFVKTFQDQINALRKEIRDGMTGQFELDDGSPNPWLELSGWNKRVHKLAQAFSNTFPITTREFTDTFFCSYNSLSYEGVRLV